METGYGEAIVLEAIVKLRNLGFLNDETFSEALIQTQKSSSSQRPKSNSARTAKKRDREGITEQVLESYSEDEQVEIARKLAEKDSFKINRSHHHLK